MIIIQDNLYILYTAHTAYAFRVTDTGHLEHLYYGKKADPADAAGSSPSAGLSLTPSAISPVREDPSGTAQIPAAAAPPGNLISYDPAHPDVTLERMSLEFSSYGKGDIREPFIELIHADGSRTCDFLFDKAQILREKKSYESLPGSYGMPENEHLCVILREQAPGNDREKEPDTGRRGLTLELHYYIYPECDVICRCARLINTGTQPVRLERLMSLMLDLPGTGYVMTTFTGAWAREMNRTDTLVHAGSCSVSSVCGSSSHRANPFFMVRKPRHPDAANGCPDPLSESECGRLNPVGPDDAGDCFGFHLIYSGNHYEVLQAAAFGMTRVLSGINPCGFSWLLMPGEAFEAPEAAMSYACDGQAHLSKNMHHFIREHIIRGTWKGKERPILLNSWEAAYFDFDEARLLSLAQAGRDVGIELFVLDDGWFGHRDDDSSSLGDWYADRRKLPEGLAGLSDRIHALGLSFGLWIEPEMVSTDSGLYRAHPDWVMQIPGRPHSEGRSERILDLANPQVVQYLTETLLTLLRSARIEYVKWDMNRIFSDVYSPYLAKYSCQSGTAGINSRAPANQICCGPGGSSGLPSDDGACRTSSGLEPARISRGLLTLGSDRQGETAHRYMLGLYRLLKNVTQAFPEILFEGCAAGGGRFDPGMLCFFPQIWASDNTDPYCRAKIQSALTCGYPPECISAHVSSSPNHQTGRESTLAYRFAVASEGILGYELDLRALDETQLDEIRRQIALYKMKRHAGPGTGHDLQQ